MEHGDKPICDFADRFTLGKIENMQPAKFRGRAFQRPGMVGKGKHETMVGISIPRTGKGKPGCSIWPNIFLKGVKPLAIDGRLDSVG